jgi:hypothetical protein
MSMDFSTLVTVPSRCTCLLFLAGLMILKGTATVSADEQDQFEGALWRFTMKPKTRGLEPLNGHYRVSDHIFYQTSKPKSRDFDKVVGKNHPAGRKTQSEFHDLRAFTKDRKLHSGIKGTANLEIIEFGEWSGRFIDAEGRHWDFRCSRIQE